LRFFAFFAASFANFAVMGLTSPTIAQKFLNRKGRKES
jgi:hypothetical protein